MSIVKGKLCWVAFNILSKGGGNCGSMEYEESFFAVLELRADDFVSVKLISSKCFR